MAEEQGTAPAEAPTLEGLTAQLFEARERGDRAEVERIDAQRSQFAKELTGEATSTAAEGVSIDDDTFAEIEATLSGAPEGAELLGPGLRETVSAAHSRAIELAEAAPGAVAYVAAIAEENPAFYAGLIKMLASEAAPRRSSTQKPKGAPMPTSNDATSPPADGARAQMLQNQLEDLLAANPPGTERYRQPKIQRQVEALHRRLHGDAPIIGRDGRTL